MKDVINAANAVTKEKLGKEIITQTLNTLNNNPTHESKKNNPKNDTDQTYEFSKSVLSAAYMDKGATIAKKG